MEKLKCYLSQAITLLRQFDAKDVNEYLEYYEHIEKCLKKNHKIHVFHPIKEDSKIPATEIYWRDLDEVDKADFLVVELSVVSWGVGQELTYAIMKGKPILALYNNKSRFKISEMVTGAGLRLRSYNGKSREWKEQIARHIAGFLPEFKQYLYLRERLCAKIR
jgi:nucleoside 2-deoxyribosyltransferase